MKIVLARHGRPNVPIGAWITPRQMKEWIEKYDWADILPDNIPSDTMTQAKSSNVIVSSPLPRCIQSAQRLCPDRNFLTEEIFREADLPYPSWNFPKLPLAAFGVSFRLAWFCGFSAQAESLAAATDRAGRSARILVELAKKHGSVFLMGHGVMTILIARHLRSWGWTGPKRPTNRHWQFSTYLAPAAAGQ